MTQQPTELHAYQVVLKHVEAGILDRTHQAGDQLPTERDLAAQLGVSRAAVREAMRVLQTQGLITSSTGPGRGTRIAPARGDALARLFQLHLALSDAATADLTETRIALERSSAAMAARRPNAGSLGRLKSLMLAMAEAVDVDDFNDLDTEFHVQLARAGQSELVADLTVAMREAVREAIRAASATLPNWPGHRSELVQEHAGILAAIEAEDPVGAANLIDDHIRRAYRRLGIAQSESV